MKKHHTLPPELWSLIAEHAHRYDLPSLALVSWVHVRATRPALFREIRLQAWSVEDLKRASVTEQLAENDGALARRVEILILKGIRVSSTSISSRRPLLPLHVLSRMSNLRMLRVSGYAPFYSEVYQCDFVKLINAHCGCLKIVEFENNSGRDQPFALNGVERITWYSSDASTFGTPFSSQTLCSLLESSFNTLTHLILPSPISGVEAQHFVPFAQSHFFPVLRTLVLGPWLTYNFTTNEIPEALAIFLYNHPTIRDLKLGWDSTTIYYAEFKWDEETFSAAELAEFLPSLHTLNILMSQAFFLAKNVPRCLFNLEELHVSTSFHDLNPSDLPTELNTIGGLPNLKRLVYTLHSNDIEKVDSRGFTRCMTAFATACPDLESWEADLPVDMRMELLLPVLSQYPNLCRIKITSWSAMSTIEYNDCYLLRIARTVAHHCPKLEQFATTCEVLFLDENERWRQKISTVLIERGNDDQESRFELVEQQMDVKEWPESHQF